MNKNNSIFVTFKANSGVFIALISMNDFLKDSKDMPTISSKAAFLYGSSISKMRSIKRQIEEYRNLHKPIPAKNIWQLGDEIFELKAKLEHMSLQIDGLYDHLIRDLGINRKWIEKVIIFRRYINDVDRVPSDLNWGRCEKGTRRVAEALVNGTYEDEHRLGK
jgi:hypothetical protein